MTVISSVSTTARRSANACRKSLKWRSSRAIENCTAWLNRAAGQWRAISSTPSRWTRALCFFRWERNQYLRGWGFSGHILTPPELMSSRIHYMNQMDLHIWTRTITAVLRNTSGQQSRSHFTALPSKRMARLWKSASGKRTTIQYLSLRTCWFIWQENRWQRRRMWSSPVRNLICWLETARSSRAKKRTRKQYGQIFSNCSQSVME